MNSIARFSRVRRCLPNFSPSFLPRFLPCSLPRLALLCLAGLLPPATAAHSLGEGYIFIDVSDASLSGWVEITLTDLDTAIGIDANGDGKVSEEEMLANMKRIRSYVAGHVSVGDRDREFDLEFTDHELRRVPISPFLILNFETREDRIPDSLRIGYRMLFDEDPRHRGFLVVAANTKSDFVNTGEGVALIFSPSSTQQDIDLTRLSAWTSFADFLRHGIWHIWIGFDHILFLIALLFPAVLVRQGSNWQPVSDFREAMWNVVKVVTLFTVAHTITLTLAALGLVKIPGRLVEAVIAASVIVAALNNVFPVIRRHIGWVVFLFGLFHGFGFASVLQELSSNAANIAADLAGFNIGVEIGQLAIVAVAFPLLYLLRSRRAYSGVMVPAGSLLIGLLAFGWFVERVANLQFMPI